MARTGVSVEQDGNPGSNIPELSVSEISGQLKRVVEDSFSLVRIRGEIAGYRGPHSSGHAYFALKDEKARIEAVIWRGVFSRLRYRPEEGMEVIATGKLTTFPGSSKYQIVIDQLEPAGAGALMALLEDRKRKLEAEGLFAPERKQLLPYLPKVIGVITSPTGAVIRDILHRIADRYPLRVLVWPVRVQGETSAHEVAVAIRGFNSLPESGPVPRPDVLIVARGGGSIEDLWGFNEEVVVRAAAESMIPLISAVGHETDWTLIDLAADVRAPTPTGAAEMAVPVKADLEASLATLSARLKAGPSRLIEKARTGLRAAARGMPAPDSLFANPRRRLDEATSRLQSGLVQAAQGKRLRFGITAAKLSPRLLAVRLSDNRQKLRFSEQRMASAWQAQAERRLSRLARARMSPAVLESVVKGGTNRVAFASRSLRRAFDASAERARGRLDKTGRLLSSFSYQKTLERGFAVVRDSGGGVVTRVADVSLGQAYGVQFADGRIEMHTGDGGPDLKTAMERTRSAGKRKDGRTDQAGLFDEAD